MQKKEFARIFNINEADLKRLITLCWEAQQLGLTAVPEVGLFYFTDMQIGCSRERVFFVIDNTLYDQHHGAEPGRSPLGDQTFVPDWDLAYAWALENGWKLEFAEHNDDGIKIILKNGEESVSAQSLSGRVAMLDAAVQGVKKNREKK